MGPQSPGTARDDLTDSGREGGNSSGPFSWINLPRRPSDNSENMVCAPHGPRAPLPAPRGPPDDCAGHGSQAGRAPPPRRASAAWFPGAAVDAVQEKHAGGATLQPAVASGPSWRYTALQVTTTVFAFLPLRTPGPEVVRSPVDGATSGTGRLSRASSPLPKCRRVSWVH